jgi:hypothetical protein
MRPEVVGAFRLAMKHEQQAGVYWCDRRRMRRSLDKRCRKHLGKAQKLYARAAMLENRGIR